MLANEKTMALQKVDVLAHGDAIDLLDWQIDWIETYVPEEALIHSLFRVYKDDFNMEVGIEIMYEVDGAMYNDTGRLH